MTILLNGLLQGVLLTALAWLLLKSVPSLNAATRYLIWWATFLAVIVLALRAVVSGAAPETSQTPTHIASLQPLHLSAPFASDELKNRGFILAIKPAASVILTDRAAAPASSISSPAWSPIQIPFKPIRNAVVILWASASFVLLVRLALSHLALRRLKLHAAPVSDQLQARFDRLSARAGQGRRGRLLVSDNVSAPMALGFFDPVILMPRCLSGRMSEREFDHIALHELAHLRRYDDWTNLLQKWLLSLLPIQPALFWIDRRLTLERETACDDWVIAIIGNARPYAAALTRVAELTLWARCGILASGAAGVPSQLYLRVQRLLTQDRNVTPNVSKPSLSIGVMMIAISSLAILLLPQMVTLGDSTPSASAPPVNEPATQPSAPGTITQSFMVQPGGHMVANVDLGNIRVAGWDQNKVQVIVTQKGPQLSEFLKHHKITMMQDGQTIRVNNTMNNAGHSDSYDVKIDYQIFVPARFDVSLDNVSGNEALSGIQGNIRASTGSGNLAFTKIDGPVNSETGSGNIAATNLNGDLYVKTGSGNLALAAIAGQIKAETGSGNVAAIDCTGKLIVNTGSGNLDLNRFQGQSFRLETGSGNIDVALAATPMENCSLETPAGNVTLQIPQRIPLIVDAKTGTGSLHCDFPLDIKRGITGGSINGAIEGGGSKVIMRTAMGNVRISKHPD